MHDGIRRATKMWLSEMAMYAPIESGFSVHPIFFTRNLIRYSYQYFNDDKTNGFVSVNGRELCIEKESVIFFPAYDVFVPELKIDFKPISAKAKIVSVIYDLLPITNPEWFPNPGTSARFEAAIQKQLLFSDKIIVNSSQVKRNLCRYVSKNKIKFHPEDVIVVGLPGLSTAQKVRQKNENKSKSKITNFLMVGTIEPRKGHDEVLVEFKKALISGLPVRLTIIGRPGWSSEMVIRNLEKLEKDFPKDFRWLRNAGNQEVLEAYLRTDLVIVASRDEGFGLPVVESLSQRKATIVRDIDVLKEVSQDCAITFGPGADYASLYEVFLNAKSVLKKGEDKALEFVPTSPNQSANLLLSHIKAVKF